MDEQTFQAKFTELLNKIKSLPADQRDGLEKMADEARQRRERVQGSISELQESLDHLRLSVKYLVFDLEATRRENSYLRRLVEQLNQDRLREEQPEEDDHHYDDEQSGAD